MTSATMLATLSANLDDDDDDIGNATAPFPACVEIFDAVELGNHSTTFIGVYPGTARCFQLQVDGDQLAPAVTTGTITAGTLTLWVVLSAVIFGTVVGNSCVILSVIMFDKMRTMSNGLIASLASADLLVAVVVMPLSLQYETTGSWTLGPHVCDLWITSDVLCCTASILNIVVIAVDRYWLITRNVRYTHSTTLPRRRICAVLIAGAWIIASLIASSPLLGWRTGSERDDPSVCLISQDPTYTVVSTFGAFWLPLGAIMIVYARIFVFARRRTAARRSAFDSGTEAAGVGTTAVRSSMPTGRCGSQRCSGCGRHGRSSPSTNARVVADRRSDYVDTAPYDDEVFDENGGQSGTEGGVGGGGVLAVARSMPTTTTRRTATVPTSLLPVGAGWNTLPLPSVSYVNDQSYVSYSLTPQESCVARTATSADGDDVVERGEIGAASDTSGAGNSELPVYVVAATGASSVIGGGDPVSPCNVTMAAVAVAADRRRKRRRALLVRRSARTLGLIIGGFVVCWLPFFIVATAMPFCSAVTRSSASSSSSSSPCHVPQTVSSVVLWLGYSNSLLNPAIYAIWDRSFRRSFQRLVSACFCFCCDCCPSCFSFSFSWPRCCRCRGAVVTKS